MQYNRSNRHLNTIHMRLHHSILCFNLVKKWSPYWSTNLTKNYTLKKCSNLWIIFCSIWTLYLSLLDVTYQTWGRVFHLISKHWEVVEKMRCSQVFFNQLQGVWISDETPFQMFDIASQTINNSWRKSKQKFTKFYDN